MYKILRLVRKSDTSPLYMPVMVEEKKLVDDPGGETNPETGAPNQVEVTETVEFSTDRLDVLEKKIIELLHMYPADELKSIPDMTYEINLLIA